MSLTIAQQCDPGAMFLQKLKMMLMYGASFKLRPYEEVVLDAWRNKLSPEGNTLLTGQLTHLVSYQRQAGDMMLCFFPLGRHPFPPLSERMLFPCRLDCAAALVHLTGADKQGVRDKIRAEISLCSGKLTFIEFNLPPSKKLVHDVEVTKVEMLRDPMIPASVETVSDAQLREDILKTIYSKLPGEYLQLVGESKGVSINGWRVHAVQDILKHPKRDGSYYLLAEKEGMTIGVKEDEFSGQVYYFDYDDDRGEKITAGLRKFFEGFRSSNK